MPRPKGKVDPATLPLPIGHHRFINAYEAQGFRPDHASEAYQTVYGCKRSSARVGVVRLLADVRVREEIARRIEATRVVTPEALGSCLLKYRHWAEEKHDYIAGASICMDQAKLAGLLVDKRADVTPDTDASAFETRLRSSLNAPLPT